MYRPHHSTTVLGYHWPSLIYNTFCVHACMWGGEKKEDERKKLSGVPTGILMHTSSPRPLVSPSRFSWGLGGLCRAGLFSAVDSGESQFSECPVPGLASAPKADLQSSTPFSQSLKTSLCFPMHTQIRPLVCHEEPTTLPTPHSHMFPYSLQSA